MKRTWTLAAPMILGLSLLMANTANASIAFRAESTSRAVIQEAELDSSLPYGGQQFAGANLEINYSRSEIVLAIRFSRPCPAGEICAEVIPPTAKIRLKLDKEVEEDSCGRLTYRGHYANARQNVEEKITIVDNRAQRCGTTMQLAATEISYSTEKLTENGEWIRTQSYFSAGELKHLISW